MTKLVTIIDYGVGNLRSVVRAFEYVGAQAEVTSDTKIVAQAERLVLPGVGAFGHCMEELKKRNLVEPVLEFAERGRPFLGVCVGMQLMLEYGEEFGEHKGLGFIKGRVQKIPDGDKRILPVIGWMELKKTTGATWDKTLLADTKEGSCAYFIHSFCANPDESSARLAEYKYDEISITAAIAKNNLMGVQFHPEKSGEVGLAMLRRFMLF